MNATDDPIDQQKIRANVARKVQQLRKERHWTQAELSRHLQLSQSRLSEIERGDGSFTAEQFLTILRLFNVGVNEFTSATPNQASELQNALARLGALHLQESSAILPSERLTNAGAAVRETLVSAESPRLITALAPVLVLNIDHVNLKRLYADLLAAGIEQRLAWVVDNTVEAIKRDAPTVSSAPLRRRYRRAQVLLESFLGFLSAAPRGEPSAVDVLDRAIRSKQTLADVIAASSPLSRRWGIATTVQVDDFIEALRGARADY